MWRCDVWIWRAIGCSNRARRDMADEERKVMKTFRTGIWFTLLVLVLLFSNSGLLAAPGDALADPARDKEMRERYEGVLLKNPFQDRAFNQVYESYSKIEGVDKWI